MQMQTPATAPASAQPAEKSGAKVLGFSILPKMDFGLELLYSQQPMELQQATPLQEDNEDLTVLGKVKRHFYDLAPPPRHLSHHREVSSRLAA